MFVIPSLICMSFIEIVRAVRNNRARGLECALVRQEYLLCILRLIRQIPKIVDFTLSLSY